jgi:glycosyltransferase involved in cell wall biosynthesis
MEKKKIAILTPDLSILNGVSMVAKYLYEIINSSHGFCADLISLATTARDSCSVRITKPGTLTKGVRIENKIFQGINFRHVGANLTEIEFFRYRPRRALNEILRPYDLVQIVAGVPMWTLAAKDFPGKIALQVATLTKVERETINAATPQPKRAWVKAMTAVNNRLERLAFERADRIFVENEWLKKLLEKDFPEKTIFAPPGIDTNFFVPAGNAGKNYILSVGRFDDARKNVRLLFHAYQEILGKLGENAAPNLVLAGQTAPTAADLSAAESLGIRNKIEILTEVSPEKLRQLYQNAAMFVLSSNEEGFGLVIAEAMASGLAVAATKCGGPEVLILENETGFLTPIGDAEALAGKILLLLTDANLREKLGAAGRKRAIEKFSHAATGKIYLETYERMLNV